MIDHLTKCNACIARKARLLKKQGKMANTWSNNYKLFIKLIIIVYQKDRVTRQVLIIKRYWAIRYLPNTHDYDTD